MKPLIVILILLAVLGAAGIAYWQYGKTVSISLIAPNGGEIWETGSVHTIQWNTKNIPATHKIAINIRRVPPPALPEEGQEFDPLVFVGLENIGSVDWTISDMYPEGNYLLGITSYASVPVTDPLSDESDMAFRIMKRADSLTYRNEKFGYSVDYPGNWTFREFPDTRTGAGFRPVSSPEDVASECVAVDARGTAENEYDTPFDAYVKKAAIVEIQGFEKLNSIEPVTTAGGLTGYRTTWVYRDMRGQEAVSLPITYFDDRQTAQTEYGELKYKTVQISLNGKECEATYDRMLFTFKLGLVQ